jgi:hypothetical protein
MPNTWKAHAQQALGDQNAPMTPSNQNAVAYTVLKSWRDQGLNPAQIAAKWNSGSETGWENKIGVNSAGVKYNVPQYVKSVTDAYQQIKGGSQNPNISPNPSTVGQAQYGAQKPEQKSVAGFVGNIFDSGAHLVGGLANAAMHPVETVKSLASTAAGAVEKPFGVQNEDTKNFDNVVNYFGQRYGGSSPSEIAHNIINTAYKDPVGVALDLSTLLDGVGAVVGGVGKVTNISRAAELTKAAELAKGADFIAGASGIETGVNTAAQLAKQAQTPGRLSQAGSMFGKAADFTNPITPVVAGVQKAVGLGGKVIGGTASKIIGEPAEVLADLVKNPADYSKAAMEANSRGGIAREFGEAVDQIESMKKATGTEYQPFIKSAEVLKVPIDWADKVLEKQGFKIDISNGVIEGTTKSATRNSADINALNKFYEVWGQKKTFTPGEFLNMREDLAELSRFDKLNTGLGKTKNIEDVGKALYEEANAVIRDKKIPELKVLDEKMAPEITQWSDIRRNFLTKDSQTGEWVLKDNAASKIANAINKPNLLKTLEGVVPGITRKIEILKNIEKIEASMGIKVATYTKSGLEVAGIATGNIPLAVGMIIAHPAIANQILRGFGYTTKATIAPILGRVRALVGALPEGLIEGTAKATVVNNKAQDSQAAR